MQAYLSGRTRTQQNLGRGLQQLQDTVSALDQVRDRDTLLQEHNNTFCMPLRFSYQPHDGDQVCCSWSAAHPGRKQTLAVTLSFLYFFFFCRTVQISEVIAECEMRFELETRFRQIQSRLKVVSDETDEVPERTAKMKMLATQNQNVSLNPILLFTLNLRNMLNKVTKISSQIIGQKQQSLAGMYNIKVLRKDTLICTDHSHSLSSQYTLFTFRAYSRYRSPSRLVQRIYPPPSAC